VALCKDAVIINRLTPDGYRFRQQTREGRKGGGVAIICNECIEISVKHQGSTESMEYIDAFVTCGNKSFELICLYRPGKNPTNAKPVPKSTFFDEFTSMLDRHDIATYDVVIAGDFNCHVTDVDDADASNFLSVLTTYDLIEYINERTHENGQTLDLIITRSSSNFVSNVTVGQSFSDHFAIKCHLRIHKPSPIKKVVKFRRLNRIDFDGFDSELYGKFDVMDSICDVDSLATTYNTIF